MMVKREIKFKLVEGNFEIWKSLVPMINDICKNNAGSCFHSHWDADDKTVIVKCEFKKLNDYENTMIKVANLFFQHGLKEKVLESKDLVLKKLAEAAGVA